MKVHHCDACKKALGKREFRVKLWAKAKEGYKMKIVRLEICYGCYSSLQKIAAKIIDLEKIEEDNCNDT